MANEKSPSASLPVYASRPDAYQTAPNLPQPVLGYVPQDAKQPQNAYYAGQAAYFPTTPLLSLHQAPALIDCPACRYRVMTRADPVSGNTTHAWAAALCFCCCIGCLPYLSSSLKDVDHYCGRCGTILATWHNSGRVEIVYKPKQAPMPGVDPRSQGTGQPQPQPQEQPQSQPQGQPQPQSPGQAATSKTGISHDVPEISMPELAATRSVSSSDSDRPRAPNRAHEDQPPHTS